MSIKIYVVSNSPYITSVHASKFYFDRDKAKEMCEILNKHCIADLEPNEWKVYKVKVRIEE